MLKQATNDVCIEGILSQVNIHEDTSKRTGKHYVGGEVIVRVPLEDRELEVPVRVFANDKTNDGRDNPAFTNIKKILDMKSIAACDGNVEQADIIRFDRANVKENAFYGRGGNFVSYPTVAGSFSSTVRKDEFKPTASFDNVIVVGGIKEEEDTNGDLTGRLIVTGILPQFGGRVDKIDYIVESEAAIKHISNNWKKGDTVRVCGLVNFTYKMIVETQEMGFGEPEIKTSTRQVKELIIRSGSGQGFDADAAYDVDEISEALQQRQAYLSELKANANNPANVVKEKKTSADFGF